MEPNESPCADSSSTMTTYLAQSPCASVGPYLVADLHVAVRRDRERPVAVELRPLAASLEDLVDRLVLLAASEQAVLQVVHVRLVGGVEVPVGRYDQGAGNLEELAHDPLVLGVAASEPLHVNAENAVPFPFSELAEHLLDFRSRVYRLGRDDLAVPLLDADSVADRKLDDPGFVLAQGLLDGHHVAALVAVVAGLAQVRAVATVRVYTSSHVKTSLPFISGKGGVSLDVAALPSFTTTKVAFFRLLWE